MLDQFRRVHPAPVPLFVCVGTKEEDGGRERYMNRVATHATCMLLAQLQPFFEQREEGT